MVSSIIGHDLNLKCVIIKLNKQHKKTFNLKGCASYQTVQPLIIITFLGTLMSAILAVYCEDNLNFKPVF